MKSTKNKVWKPERLARRRFSFLLILFLSNLLTFSEVAYASPTNTLTVTKDLDIEFAVKTIPGSTSESESTIISGLDSGEWNCKTLFFYFTHNSPIYQGKRDLWLIFDKTYVVKNEKGTILKSGTASLKYSKILKSGKVFCRVSFEISKLPVAKFYVVETNDGENLVPAFSASKFKSQKAQVFF